MPIDKRKFDDQPSTSDDYSFRGGNKKKFKKPEESDSEVPEEVVEYETDDSDVEEPAQTRSQTKANGPATITKFENLARIPTLIGERDEKVSDHRDAECLFNPIMGDLEKHEKDRSHVLNNSELPTETTLKIWSYHNYDVKKTIADCKKQFVPDLVPDCIKDFFAGNIAEKRGEFYQLKEKEKEKAKKAPEFYFAKMFKKVVDSKSLVEYYYNEKNKVGANWRMDKINKEYTAEEDEELERKMKEANITIIMRDDDTSKNRKKKGKKRKMNNAPSTSAKKESD